MSLFPGGIESEYQSAYSQLSSSTKVKASVAKGKFELAIKAASGSLATVAESQRQSKFIEYLSAGMNGVSEFAAFSGAGYSGATAMYGALQKMQAHAQDTGSMHLQRTGSDQEQYLRGQQAAADSHVRYRDYSTVAPDVTRVMETAAEQTVADVGALATGQGWRPAGVGPLGKRRAQVRVPGQCDAFDVVCKAKKWWEHERWKVYLGIGGTVVTVIAIYALMSGVGQGLVT